MSANCFVAAACIDGTDKEEISTKAKRDIQRLKCNWLFILLACLLRGINLICVIPTNHQFIINPTPETLNITEEDIEPGLEQSETFYSLTYVILFSCYSVSAVGTGLLFNVVPPWYLFLLCTLSHTIGYLLYALATNGWMMILARALAGVQTGALECLAFAYFARSFERYTDNLKTLGKFDSHKAKKHKGYVFSIFNIGNSFGLTVGVAVDQSTLKGFPAILAQFPQIPQFRIPAWFCVSLGGAVLLLQLLLFHGEMTQNCVSKDCFKKHELKSNSRSPEVTHPFICQIVVPLYVILVSGLKGIQYVLPEVLTNPILSDIFGFSYQNLPLFFLLYVFTAPTRLIILYALQYFNFRGFWLSVLGLIFTIVSVLIMTDWQAIGNDPCTEYSLLHNSKLADQYRQELAEYDVFESGMVSVQSLQVVEEDVYELEVNRCQSAGKDCHWIPNSIVTGTHCSDCQPICRSIRHSLNFVQFTIGNVVMYLTTPLMYLGLFLLLANCVSQHYQGISAGAATALIGAGRGVFPLILDYAYEKVEKRTYLVMLVQVVIYVPLLIGLILLYPWLEGSRKIDYSTPPSDQDCQCISQNGKMNWKLK